MIGLKLRLGFATGRRPAVTGVTGAAAAAAGAERKVGLAGTTAAGVRKDEVLAGFPAVVLLGVSSPLGAEGQGTAGCSSC